MAKEALYERRLKEVYGMFGPRDGGGLVSPKVFAAMSAREVDKWDFPHRHRMHSVAKALVKGNRSKQRNLRSAKAFCIVSGRVILPFSVRSTRKQAISDFVADHTGNGWEALENRGYACIPIELSEVSRARTNPPHTGEGR